MLYHDMRQQIMIWLSAEQPPDIGSSCMMNPFRKSTKDTENTYRMRWVISVVELQEKIRIADSELDDRIVELFKQLIRNVLKTQGDELTAELRFLRLATSENGEKDVVLSLGGEGEEGAFNVGFDKYEALATRFAPHLDRLFRSANPWLRVDEATL